MAYKCWGINPKNDSQREAIKHLLDNNIDCVILEGTAGSGKTLLALAAGLELTFNKCKYQEIVFTRAPISVGFDMGHLPGDINEKMTPWCGALLDNMEILLDTSSQSLLQRDATAVVIQNKIKLYAMMHMRGRSLYNKWIIVDECQNLYPSELKVLLTRIGENSKLILIGDTSQIDNKKLNQENNGLQYLIGAYQYSQPEFIKHISLETCVRSRLCNWGVNCL